MEAKALGNGAFGVVVKGTHIATGQERAIKQISKKKIKNMESFM